MTKSLVIFCEIRFLQVYVTVLDISILKLVKFRICYPVMFSICLHTFLNDVLSFRAQLSMHPKTCPDCVYQI